MAARDRYKVKVKCPHCEAIGMAHVSEDDYPFMKDLHRAIDKIDGPFKIIQREPNLFDAQCKECGDVHKIF